MRGLRNAVFNPMTEDPVRNYIHWLMLSQANFRYQAYAKFKETIFPMKNLIEKLYTK